MSKPRKPKPAPPATTAEWTALLRELTRAVGDEELWYLPDGMPPAHLAHAEGHNEGITAALKAIRRVLRRHGVQLRPRK